MATLYVENIPDELYASLRSHARRRRKSIAGQILTMLEERFPSERELKRRRRIVRQLDKLREKPPLSAGPFPSTEQMLREDRER
jgi:hypothetical protein